MTPRPGTAMHALRRRSFPFIVALFQALIFGAPIAMSALLIRLLPWWAALLLTPHAAVTTFVLVAGLLSLPWRFSIQPGRVTRDVGDPTYFARRLYGCCWTAVYYFPPIYQFCLATPPLRWLLFRLFGYRGSMRFTVYPDTWLRDLPLLQFEDGAYVANRATLGTNIALPNNTLLVDRIALGRNALVGHAAMVGPGVTLGDNVVVAHQTMIAPHVTVGAGTQIGVGCAIGVAVTIGKNVQIEGGCGLNHRAKIGDDAFVGPMSYVGRSAEVGAGARLAAGSRVEDRSRFEGR